MCVSLNLSFFFLVYFLYYSHFRNILGQRPAAIVTPIAGTTRDVLEVTLNIGGYPLVLADTAGLRSQTNDLIEKEGISRAMILYEKSDLIVLVINVIKYEKWINLNSGKTFTDYLRTYLETLKLNNLINKDNNVNMLTKDCLIVLNKIDLASSKILEIKNQNLIKMSCKTEDGASQLVDSITKKLQVL